MYIIELTRSLFFTDSMVSIFTAKIIHSNNVSLTSFELDVLALLLLVDSSSWFIVVAVILILS